MLVQTSVVQLDMKGRQSALGFTGGRTDRHGQLTSWMCQVRDMRQDSFSFFDAFCLFGLIHQVDDDSIYRDT